MCWLDVASAKSADDIEVKDEILHRRDVLMKVLNAPAYRTLEVVQFKQVVSTQDDAASARPMEDGDDDDDARLNTEQHLDNESPNPFSGDMDLTNFLVSVGNKGLLIDKDISQRTFKFTGMNVNGGRCRFNYDSTRKLIMIGMNGDETRRFITQVVLLYQYVMGDLAPEKFGLWKDALQMWDQQVKYMESKSVSENASFRDEAVGHAKEFVKAYRKAAGAGSITYYLHTMSAHTEWFYCMSPGGKFSLVAWWSAQAVEAGHKLRKRALRSHTRHGMAISRWASPRQDDDYARVDTTEGDDHDGVEDNCGAVRVMVTSGAGIYELFRWQFRLVCYRRLEQLEKRGVTVKSLTIKFFNQLAELSPVNKWTETMLVKMLKYPAGTAIRVTGPGELKQPLQVEVSSGTYFAEAAFEKAGGMLTVTGACHKGRKAFADLPEERQQRIRQQWQGLRGAAADHGIHQTPYTDYADLYTDATG
jgi:hypothetical protein